MLPGLTAGAEAEEELEESGTETSSIDPAHELRPVFRCQSNLECGNVSSPFPSHGSRVNFPSALVK